MKNEKEPIIKTMKYLFLLLLSINFLPNSIKAQNIVINELIARNSDARLGLSVCNPIINLCPGFVELRNMTNADIDISNYFLSDDPTDIRKWQVPAGTIIGANGFLLLFERDTNSRTPALVLNFNLSSEGETLVLSDTSGTEIQQLTYPIIQNDIAYGRLNNNSYSFMSTATPGAANLENTAFEFLDASLQTNIASGIYSGPQSIELSHTGIGTIFYTLDGSTPTVNSIPYTAPIAINTNTVLKAIVIENSNLFSVVENRSYIIGANHELPVILLTTDNSSSGRSNKELIDGRVEFNFIETDGTTVINQYANFRATGNVSRFTIPQINGKVEASEVYGDGDFDYKMYPYKDTDEFNSFLFRNSSQDWFTTHIRDAFVSRLIGKDNLVNIPFEGYRPAVIYVNTIYQGIVNIKEDDDNDYIRHNFNLKKEEFTRNRRSLITPNNPLPTDRDALNSVINFNSYNNIRFLNNYSGLTEIGFGWWEDLSGKSGQRYHYLVHDYDPILGFSAGTRGVPLSGPMDVSSLLDSEIEANPIYRNEALQFIASAINHIYNTDRAIAILDEMEDELENEMDAHGQVNVRLNMERPRSFTTPFFTNQTEWSENVEIVRANIRSRIDATIFNRIQAEYNLDNPIEVTYNSSDINQGFIRVHEIEIQDQTASGTYFSNIPLKLTAEALPGFRFLRWEGDTTGTTTNIAPVFNSNANITAVFAAIPLATNDAIINEVQGKNDTTIADENGEFDDWIEIYNPTASPINLAGLYFSDNISEPLKWQIPNTDASRTTVPANGYLLLWADNDLSQGENHLGFKLKGSDQVIVTYPDGITEKQRIEYNDIDSDESFGAESDGSSTFILFTSPTPNATNNGVPLSISEIAAENSKTEVSFFPNPTTTDITITGLQGELNWKLYTINGGLITSGTSNKVNMQNLSNGLYFISVNDVTILKVIKQ